MMNVLFSQKEIESAANDHQVDDIGFRDGDIRRSVDIDKINKAATYISSGAVVPRLCANILSLTNPKI